MSNLSQFTGFNLGVTSLSSGLNIAVSSNTGAVTVSFTGTLPTANGGTGNSTFNPPALICLSTATVSATPVATVDFTTSIDSTYDEYELHFINVVPSVSGSRLWFRTSSNGGSSFDSASSDYVYGEYGIRVSTSGSLISSSTGSNHIELDGANGTSGTSSDGGISGTITLYSPSQSSSNKQIKFQVTSSAGGTEMYLLNGGGMRLSSNLINGIRLLFSAGNISSGLFKLYGIRKLV